MAKKLQIKDLNFKYALGDRYVLRGIDLELDAGEKVLLSGISGSGKSTLLKVISPMTSPRGGRSGSVLIDGTDVRDMPRLDITSKVAYVAQNPENGIVVDTVYGELAFCCENIGMNREEVRRRVAWTASYFGIEDILKRKISELSGGQKQIVSLAAAIMLKPEILLLDEPTTYLDPIQAVRFLDLVDNLNRDFGMTVIVAEHRVESFAGRFDRVVKIEEGVLLDMDVRTSFNETDMFYERVFALNDGAVNTGDPAVSVKNLEFRYAKDGPNVLDGANVDIPKGSIYALLGANGCGKTTFLRCLTCELKPQRGNVKIRSQCAAMTQNPLSMFIEETPEKDYRFFLKQKGFKKEEADARISEVAEKLELTEDILKTNVLDLSGGETERAAMAKLLLAGADVLLFDEPTKGLDSAAKAKLTGIMKELAERGITIIFVTHDVGFALSTADRAGVLSAGSILE